jgi:Initiator Replication protein
MSDIKLVQPFKNPDMVVLRNPVARAKFGLSLVQTKFLFEVLAYFKDHPEQRYARFYLRDYLSKLGVSSNNFKEYVNQMEDMRRRDINIPRSGDSSKLHFIGVSLFASAEYMLDENGDGYVEIEVSDKLKPYFLEITKGEFFYYHILNTRVLRSTYSIKLYLLLKSYRRFGKLEIGLQELREILEIAPDEYLQYKNFKARVLETARIEMQEKNDICFEYEDVRRNRKSPIEKIVFRITDNPNAKEILEKARQMFAKSESTLFEKDFVSVQTGKKNTNPAHLFEEINTTQADTSPSVTGAESSVENDILIELIATFKFFDKEATDEDIQAFVQNYEFEKVIDVLLYAKEQTAKGKTDIKNIYPYVVAGVRGGYGKGLYQKHKQKLAKETENTQLKAQKIKDIEQLKSRLEVLADTYEKAKNDKIRELTSLDPMITDRAVEAVKTTFATINPSVADMTIDDFRINPMYREFVKKEIYEAYKSDFLDIDTHFLPQIEQFKKAIFKIENSSIQKK